jgi:hypothetical protein
MMQSLAADRVLTAVNAAALTIAKNLRGGGPHWTGYCSDIAKIFLYLSGLAQASVPMKSES